MIELEWEIPNFSTYFYDHSDNMNACALGTSYNDLNHLRFSFYSKNSFDKLYVASHQLHIGYAAVKSNKNYNLNLCLCQRNTHNVFYITSSHSRFEEVLGETVQLNLIERVDHNSRQLWVRDQVYTVGVCKGCLKVVEKTNKDLKYRQAILDEMLVYGCRSITCFG